jgi:hypothetical protein
MFKTKRVLVFILWAMFPIGVYWLAITLPIGFAILYFGLCVYIFKPRPIHIYITFFYGLLGGSILMVVLWCLLLLFGVVLPLNEESIAIALCAAPTVFVMIVFLLSGLNLYDLVETLCLKLLMEEPRDGCQLEFAKPEYDRFNG